MPDEETPPFSSEGRDARQSVRDDLMRDASDGSAQSQQWQPSIAERLKSLGFVGEASKAFDLLPLVLVAWADGAIQAEERAKILEVLRIRGLQGTATFTMFAALLEVRPADVYLQAALELLQEFVSEQADDGASVVELCIEVAAAAGDALGSSDPISAEEREAISHVAETLGSTAHAEFTRRLGKRR